MGFGVIKAKVERHMRMHLVRGTGQMGEGTVLSVALSTGFHK